jgi:hypothetical protein
MISSVRAWTRDHGSALHTPHHRRTGIRASRGLPRVLSAADRAARRVKIAARGEAGTMHLAYTLTTVWDTSPVLLAYLGTSIRN